MAKKRLVITSMTKKKIAVTDEHVRLAVEQMDAERVKAGQWSVVRTALMYTIGVAIASMFLHNWEFTISCVLMTGVLAFLVKLDVVKVYG